MDKDTPKLNYLHMDPIPHHYTVMYDEVTGKRYLVLSPLPQHVARFRFLQGCRSEYVAPANALAPWEDPARIPPTEEELDKAVRAMLVRKKK
jgi:hypothetical protein